MTKPKTYAFKGTKRSGRCVVEEFANRVHLDLQFSAYGNLGDEAEVNAWLFGIISQFENDPRPLTMANPHSGEVAAVTDGKGAVWRPPAKE